MCFNKGLDFIEIMYIFLQISIGGLSSGYGREQPGTGILLPLGIAPDTQGQTPGPETTWNGPQADELESQRQLPMDWS